MPAPGIFATSDLGLAALLHAEGVEPELVPTSPSRVEFHYPRTAELADLLGRWTQGQLTPEPQEVAESRRLLRAMAVVATAGLQRHQGR